MSTQDQQQQQQQQQQYQEIEDLFRSIPEINEPKIRNQNVPFEIKQVGMHGEFYLDMQPNDRLFTGVSNTTYVPMKSVDTNKIRNEMEQRYLGASALHESASERIQESSRGRDVDTQREFHEQLRKEQRIWPREFDSNELYKLETSKPTSVLQVVKGQFSGHVTGFEEVQLKSDELNQSSETMSLLRRPAKSKDFVRGSVSNMPFLPGGLEDDQVVLDFLHGDWKHYGDEKEKKEEGAMALSKKEAQQLAETELHILDNDELLERAPPGMAHGLKIMQEKPQEVKTKADLMMPPSTETAIETGKNPSHLLSPFLVNVEEIYQQERDLEEEKRFYPGLERQREDTRRQIVRLGDVFGADGIDDPFAEEEEDILEEKEQQQSASLQHESHALESLMSAPEDIASEPTSLDKGRESIQRKRRDSLDELLGGDDELSSSLHGKKKEKKREWAKLDKTDVSRFDEMVPDMAIEYPFDLDVFQKQAIWHLENGESVFVAAHTSAGKTVVAEYAIALAQKHLTRIIYTSPIKTLSNQKYREFQRTFGDVGILTGDVQINPTATCLIMTTEILRSMLYKGADLIRDVEYVIFDEVHYINDAERGVVWEEVIIMLPEHIKMILLSATVPNTFEFADWIGRTKKKPVHVVSTFKRPVPLEHHLYYNTNMYKIVDHTSTFLNVGYRSALQSEKERKGSAKGGPSKQLFKSGSSKSKTEKMEWGKLIDMLTRRNLLPVVVFSFSRKRCEELAFGLSTTDLNTAVEKREIHTFIERAINRLRPEDRDLPQVIKMKDIAKRGIGIHHSGLLPIVKEIIEMLFSKGLVKVLFATETFAMGVNFPTRCVVFNSLRKHDGRTFRDLLSSEYTQMSGRAGRRGLDNVGIVIINCGFEIPEEPTLQRMILGKPTRLESQFRLSYNMILNLMRMEDFRIEDMIKRSFSEAHNAKFLPDKNLLRKSMEKLQNTEPLECILGEPTIDEYYGYARRIESINKFLQAEIFKTHGVNQLLSAGRLCVVRSKQYGTTLGAYIRTVASDTISDLRAQRDPDELATMTRSYLMLVIRVTNPVNFVTPSTSGLPYYSPLLFTAPDQNSNGEVQIHNSALSDYEIIPERSVLTICNTKLNVAIRAPPTMMLKRQKHTREDNAMRAAAHQMLQIWESKPEDGPEPIDPVSELKINNLDFVDNYRLKRQLNTEMKQVKCAQCPKLAEQYEHIDRRTRLRENLEKIKFALSNDNLEMMPDFNKRLYVLKRLQYVSESGTVQLKGRVACEIRSCEELIVTEMVFENFFTPLEPEEVVAVLSCLVNQTKSDIAPNLTERVEEAKEKLIQLTMTLGQMQLEAGMDTTPLEYTNTTLNFALMEVAYEWARSMTFHDITTLTDISEGNIVRAINHLDQACREVRNAARVIGDSALYTKMERCEALIKRDIVFSASLYIS